MSTAWHPLPWQLDAWTRLTTLASQNRLSHALLLAGPRGVGKAHFALGLGAYLLCEATAGTRKPCGVCRSCIQIASTVHPNLMRLGPAEDKRDIAIDDVRALIERLQLSSHYNQAKIAIVQPADALNASGVNALLKTIEEPPAATHIFLVAERWRALPATLRSRCQILRFAPPPASQARAWLKEKYPDYSAEALSAVTRMPMRAAEFLEKEAVETREQWSKALTALANGHMQSLKLADKCKRDQAQAGLEFWLQVGADWLKILLSKGSANRAFAVPVPERMTVAIIQQLLTDSMEGLRGLERNGNPAMILESIMIRYAKGASVRNSLI